MERGSLIMFFTRIEREVLASVAVSTMSHLLFFLDAAVMLGKEKKRKSGKILICYFEPCHTSEL